MRRRALSLAAAPASLAALPDAALLVLVRRLRRLLLRSASARSGDADAASSSSSLALLLTCTASQATQAPRLARPRFSLQKGAEIERVSGKVRARTCAQAALVRPGGRRDVSVSAPEHGWICQALSLIVKRLSASATCAQRGGLRLSFRGGRRSASSWGVVGRRRCELEAGAGRRTSLAGTAFRRSCLFAKTISGTPFSLSSSSSALSSVPAGRRSES